VKLTDRDRGERAPVGWIVETIRIGQHEDPLAIGVGLAMVPRPIRGVAVVAGGDEGDHGRTAVVAADSEDKAHAPVRVEIARGDQCRPCRVGDRRQADLRPGRRGKAAGERLDGARDYEGVRGTHPLRAEVRQLGHEHSESGARERTRERHETRVVLAFGDEAGNENESGLGRGVRQVEVGGRRASGERQAPHPRGPVPGLCRTAIGRESGQEPRRFEGPLRCTGREGEHS
jgi:hypothetical protein